MKNTLVYLEAGMNCLFSEPRTKAELKAIKQQAKECGHVGYLSGYRYYNNEGETVIVYCKEQPTADNIDMRRRNGFRAARWYWIN
jgi:hypothetical protein